MSQTTNAGRRIVRVGIIVAVAGSSLARGQEPAKSAMPLRLTAFAVDTTESVGTLRPGALAAATVEITIERWSTAEERAALLEAFQKDGTPGLLTALQKTAKVGSIHTPNTHPWHLHYAAQVPTDNGGRRILIATDRKIGYWEANRGARSTDYPFTLIEVRLDSHGEGEGKLALATNIVRSKDGSEIELESYSSEPVRLQDIRVLKN